ncbi:PIN domain-containing protein [Piscinibacter sakaiensis]
MTIPAWTSRLDPHPPGHDLGHGLESADENARRNSPKADDYIQGPLPLQDMSVPCAPAAAELPPAIVLDTHVLLDWLVFRDARLRPLEAALVAGHLRWIAVPAMRDEWDAVLARGVGADRGVAAADVDAAWARHVHWHAPTPEAVGLRHRCSDPSDQKFIDLALHAGARWLLSRDRAVLKLARRARPFGVEITTPETWSARLGLP